MEMVMAIVRGKDGREVVYDIVNRKYLSFWIRKGYIIAIPYGQLSVEEIEKLSSEGIVLEADADRQLLRVKN